LDVEVEGQAVESEARRATELEVGEGTIIPELFGVLPGKNVGEVAEADVTLPAEHPDPSLAGHAAHLRMTVRGVKEKLVPDLDDDLAGRLSGGRQGTAAEFREAVRGELEVAAERVDELAYEQQVLKRLVEASAVEIPQSLVDREVARHVEDLQTRLSRQGLRLDRYLDYLGTTGEEWLAQAGPDAEGRLKVDMVLEEVSRRESVEPAEEELVAYTREETARDPEPEGKVDEILASPAARDYFTHRLRRLQTLRRLVELAAGNAHPKEAPAGPAPVAPATSSSAHRT
ncbi:MAG: hypothetical protein ACREPA_05425, partial [Candidatus Dormibacteraceae bacterium]